MFSENFNRSISATANLGVGDVIGGAFGAIRKHWIVFGAYALLLTCLPAMWFGWLTNRRRSRRHETPSAAVSVARAPL